MRALCLLLVAHFAVFSVVTADPLQTCEADFWPDLVPEAGSSRDFAVTTDLVFSKGSFHYESGKTYTVTLVGVQDSFEGWILQAREPDSEDALLGTFLPDTETQQLVACDDLMNDESTVSHDNPLGSKFRKQVFTWKAPSLHSKGTVDFYYSVEAQQTLYTGLRASETLLDELAATELLEADSDSGSLVFPLPANCVSDCALYIEITRNSDPSKLTFDMYAKAIGWVAIGFSDTANMMSADVFACSPNPDTGMVEALDTFNSNDSYNNIPDTNQSDIALISGSFEDGIISCNFTRTIAGNGNVSEDFNLDAYFYVLYGRRNAYPVVGALLTHVSNAPLPSISSSTINPTTATGVVSPSSFAAVKKALIKTHGILMLIAWPLLASTGIFFAAWMRPALPNGEWFQVHRALMLTSLFVASVGFVLIFVSQINSTIPGLISLGSDDKTGTAHFAIGIIVMFLQILNPILAAFRCSPDKKLEHCIFKIIHGYTIGLTAEILAHINIILGLAIFSYAYSDEGGAPLWLFVAYTILMVVLYIMGFPVLKYRLSKPKSDKPEEMALQPHDDDDDDAAGGDGPSKGPVKWSLFLWIALGIFLGVTITVVTVQIVLIAV